MSDFIGNGDLQEMRWNGPYYTWTNKTIWSRIDRALINIYWYEVFDFTQNHYLANESSDHTPMLIKFPLTDFNKTVDSVVSPLSNSPLNQLRVVMEKLRSRLSKLNRDKYADLRAQLKKAREELTNIQMQLQVSPGDTPLIQAEKDLNYKYSDILSSSLALMQEQCKIEWINYGDECTRIFFAKAKQRKLASYIYQIKDANGDLVEGFDQVSSTLQTFYKVLLREQNTIRKQINMEVAHHGPSLTKDQQVLLYKDFTDKEIRKAIYSIPNFKSPGPDGYNSGHLQKIGPLVCAAVKEFFAKGTVPIYISETRLIITGLKNSSFPLTYLGVLITASRLTKIEYASLVEKIIARVHLWATRNISFIRRARLINNVIFRMFSYWASIFLLPNEVTEKITKIYRNYLWSGTVEYKKAPYIS
ncbi:hypothetical protein Cgig2_033631 [Carnegiea gigantea]|uniref:Reverse transcriptase n=1 Tax=Carnegiea gigantea TaxID=171969 RepID=A0A9Q1K2U3_9CARY|nr:hypothetical protein Cgig2_033631 [Carnegiea gigantea]